MLKFFAQAYYHLLAIVFLFFVFNCTIRDTVLQKVYSDAGDAGAFDPHRDALLTNARDFCIYLLFGLLGLLLVFSVTFLSLPKLHQLNRKVLVSVTGVIVAFIFIFISLFGH